MSKLWAHFTKENPCPACGKGGDWCCRAGDKKFICMRVESPHPSRDGGFYHDYGGKPKPQAMPKRIQIPKPKMDFDSIVERSLNHSDIDLSVREYAHLLGVSEGSLIDLMCGWSEEHEAHTFPMRDGSGKIIGVQLRGETKRCITGSQGGLFIPQSSPQKEIFICEGVSNAAALLTMGFWAIGRFNCNSGADMLKVALKRLGVARIIIVADNDTIKTAPNGKTFRPGQDGAARLKKELGLMSVIYTTPNPIKDVRQLLNKFGVETARQMIENSVAMKIWTRV